MERQHDVYSPVKPVKSDALPVASLRLPQERILFGHVLWHSIASFVNPAAGIAKNAGNVSPSPARLRHGFGEVQCPVHRSCSVGGEETAGVRTVV